MAQDCYHRSLTPVEGNGQEGLPMESHTEEIRQQLYDYTLVVVQAPPGTGKTLVVPETAWCWAEQAVLLTEPTRFAAQKLVEYFQKCRSWWMGEHSTRHRRGQG